MKLLATRQPADNSILKQSLIKFGWQVYCWPALIIEPLPILIDEDSYNKVNVIIILSKNCLQSGLFGLLKKHENKIICIGKSTALQLKNKTGIMADVPTVSSTEGLLKTARLNKCQHVLVIKGENGRKKLVNNLIKKGIKVEVIEAYKRKESELAEDERKRIIKFNPDTIIASSVEGLFSILRVFEEEKKAWIKKLKMVSFSKRINKSAREIGFSKISTVEVMSNAGVVEQLVGKNEHCN